MSEDCIFCNADPKVVVYDGPDGKVILDLPARPGHVLVGIKSHKTNLHDADPQEVASMMALATKVSKAIVEKLGAEKTYVAAIGDKDKHFHVHLIPKFENEPLLGKHIFSAEGWAEFLPTEVNDSEIDEVTIKIREALS